MQVCRTTEARADRPTVLNSPTSSSSGPVLMPGTGARPEGTISPARAAGSGARHQGAAAACGSSLVQVFRDALGDRRHLELGAGDVLQQLVRVNALAFRPELAEQRAGLALREPGVPEVLAQVRAKLRLEGPRTQVFGDVEAGVDVGEVVG